VRTHVERLFQKLESVPEAGMHDPRGCHAEGCDPGVDL